MLLNVPETDDKEPSVTELADIFKVLFWSQIWVAIRVNLNGSFICKLTYSGPKSTHITQDKEIHIPFDFLNVLKFSHVIDDEFRHVQIGSKINHELIPCQFIWQGDELAHKSWFRNIYCSSRPSCHSESVKEFFILKLLKLYNVLLSGSY